MSGHAESAAECLSAARAGSPEALGLALESCRSYLLLIAQHELDSDLQAKGGASDLVQETLVDAVRDFVQFEGQSQAELQAWLRQLLINNLIDFTRHYRNVAKREIGRERELEAGNSSSERGGDLKA